MGEILWLDPDAVSQVMLPPIVVGIAWGLIRKAKRCRRLSRRRARMG